MGALVGVTWPDGVLVGAVVGIDVGVLVGVIFPDGVLVGVAVGTVVGVGDIPPPTPGVTVGVIDVVGAGVPPEGQVPDPIVTFAGDIWKSTFSVGSSPGDKENTLDLSWSNWI